ncbi:hypothetical protein EGT07_17295 [Herbaspirillum sp. HC18]|nr:hypothetical protein EGT07_17295 [Herbaspirillum sp. HC18]
MTFRMMTLAAIALAFPLSTLAAEPGGHHHEAQAQQKLELNAGKKWATDEALRKGMTSIRSSVAAALPAAHSGKMTTAGYEALAKDLGGQIGYIVQNCKLDPKADAQLHLVLEHVINGVDTIEGKTQEKNRASGVVRIADALNTYGKYFDHAGWQSIKMPH